MAATLFGDAGAAMSWARPDRGSRTAAPRATLWVRKPRRLQSLRGMAGTRLVYVSRSRRRTRDGAWVRPCERETINESGAEQLVNRLPHLDQPHGPVLRVVERHLGRVDAEVVEDRRSHFLRADRPVGHVFAARRALADGLAHVHRAAAHEH